jgi:hypothetical protein
MKDYELGARAAAWILGRSITIFFNIEAYGQRHGSQSPDHQEP